jgi:hypothetical protein
MVAKKKKTKKKVGTKKVAKRPAPKKKSSTRKSSTKKSSIKKSTVKKSSVKKKTAVKKSATKKTGNTIKKAVTGKTVSKNSIPPAVNTPQKKPVSTKQKLSSGKSKKIGSMVKTLTGRMSGEKGIIVRQDASLGTFFILLDSLKDNAVYKNIEWGPYFESQLEFLKKR